MFTNQKEAVKPANVKSGDFKNDCMKVSISQQEHRVSLGVVVILLILLLAASVALMRYATHCVISAGSYVIRIQDKVDVLKQKMGGLLRCGAVSAERNACIYELLQL